PRPQLPLLPQPHPEPTSIRRPARPTRQTRRHRLSSSARLVELESASLHPMKYLVSIALGPVQEFIAQARRTRDLWYGSHLLSELSRAAARHLADGGAELIFPALARGDDELLPCRSPVRPNGRPPLNVANRLLAEVHD